MTEKARIRNRDEIREILRRYISHNFLPQAGIETFADTDSFIEKGIIDSTGVLELLEFIEGDFGVKVEDEEVIPANLDCLENLTGFVHRKLRNVST